jgi:hypothetical protein
MCLKLKFKGTAAGDCRTVCGKYRLKVLDWLQEQHETELFQSVISGEPA